MVGGAVGGGPGPGRVRAAATLDAGLRAGQAGVRSARRRWRRCGAREEAAARGCRTDAWLPSSDGWATTVRGCRGACRRGGRARRADGLAGGNGRAAPARPRLGYERSRLAADSAVTCDDGWWAWEDLNLGPHPDPKIHGEQADGSTRRSAAKPGPVRVDGGRVRRRVGG